MENLIKKLQARPLEKDPQGSDFIREFEQISGFPLPAELSSLLNEVGGAVVFDLGARFIPAAPSGREDRKGFLALEVLYGGSDDLNSLHKRYDMLRDQLPPGTVAIGEAPGGDQICLEQSSGRILFWKHDAEPSRAISAVAENTAAFFDRLEADGADEKPADRVVIKEKSFLNF